MSKKYTTIVVTGTAFAVFSLFSVFNALALGADGEKSPLEEAQEFCEYQKRYVSKETAGVHEQIADYSEQIADARADGDDTDQLQTELDDLHLYLDDLASQERKACVDNIEAARKEEAAYNKNIIAACKGLKKSYKRDIARVKAKGLSAQYSKEDITQMVQNIKKDQKETCIRAKKAQSSLKKFK
jgi:gluconate kinase